MIGKNLGEKEQMPRPKSLKKFPLIPGENIIKSDEFEIGFTGKVDLEGRIPKVGKEYSDREVWVFIKKDGKGIE